MEDVALSIRRYSAEVVSHRHAHHQIVMALEGALLLSVDAREIRAEGRSGALVPGEARHAFAASPPSRFLVIDLPGAAAEELGVTPWIERAAGAPLVLDADCALLIRAAAAALDADGPDALRRAWAGLLVLTLAERDRRARAGVPERLRRALRFIEEHACEPLTVADVAARVELSPGHLHHLFRTVLGTTVQARIAELRLARATELLARTDLGIAEIALRCGYADQSCLTRSLRRRHGVTPAALRRAGRPGSAAERSRRATS